MMITSFTDPGPSPRSDSECAWEESPLVAAPVSSTSKPTRLPVGRRQHPAPFHIRRALFTSVACGVGFILIFLGFESEWFERFEELGFSPGQMSAQSMADNAQAHFLPLEFKKEGHKEPPEGCEATVMLVRHCEKSDRKANCDYVGFERSVYLATLFGNHEERWPSPSYIFALHPGHRSNPKKRNFREIQTVLPVAEKFELDVDANYTIEDKSGLARAIMSKMNNGDMCGKVALISWKHSDLPPLARKLGTWLENRDWASRRNIAVRCSPVS
jgi:hypothetical protein